MTPILSVVAVVLLGLVSIPCRVVAMQGADTAVINMEPGQVMLELVGQMVDVPTDLPRSNQFGFLVRVFYPDHDHTRDYKRAARRRHSRRSDRNLLYAMPPVRIAVSGCRQR
jgi:hypothetical protein